MTSKRMFILVGAFVGVLTFVVFNPTLNYEFVNWDDNIYVYQNPRLHPVTFENVAWFFTHPYFRSWTPITLLSHAVDVSLWQFNPFGHHLTNVLLHSINAALVFWLSLHVLDAFRKKAQPREGIQASESSVSSSMISGSVIAALLFALHPLRAESAAWVSDRKDLLCALFMLLTAIVYFTRREDPKRFLGNYALFIFLYALALGSKSVAMVLPVALVMLDVLLFRRKFTESLKEMIPLFLLAAATGLVARLAAPELDKDFVVGEKTTLQLVSFPFTVILFYLKKLILPADLSPVYHTNAFLPPANSMMLFVAPIVILAVTGFCFFKLKRGRSHWILAWGTFILFLSPTLLGLLSGIQPVADRYTYFASISLCLQVGGGVERLFRPHGREIFSVRSRIILALSVTCLSFLSYTTLHQIKVWKDPMTLWTYVIPRAPFPLAYNNLGMIQVEKRMFDEAIVSFTNAIKLKPSYGEAMCNMGIAYNKMGQTEKAIQSYHRAIQIQPGHLDSYINLGTEYRHKGMVDSAISTYERALRFDSTFASARYNIAIALMKQNKYAEAVVEYQKVVALEPWNADAWYNLGVAYESQSQQREAIACYANAIEYRKDYLDAYINLGNLYAMQGQSDMALQTFGKAIAVSPQSADAYYNLGYVLYGLGEIERACKSFEIAIRCDSSYAKAYYNLGIIFEQRGEPERAVTFLQGAARLGYEDSQQLLRKKGINW